MNITFDDIKRITYGAVRFDEREGCLFPHRCTEKQENIWAKYIPDAGKYSKMSAGIRLDFHTSSSKIQIQLAPVEADGYDILVNGTLIKSVKGSECVFDKILPSGEKRITVVFPIGANGGISELVLDDDASLKAHTYKRNFLFLGDSITQGFQTEHPSCTYAYRVSEFFDADFLNQAVGCADLYAAALDNNIKYNTDCVFLAFGTNDYNHFSSIKQLKTRAIEYIEYILNHYKSQRLFALLPIWRADENPARAMGTFEECRQTPRKLHEECGFEVIDCYGFLPHCTEYYSDGFLHPNALGYSFYSQNLIKALINKIK